MKKSLLISAAVAFALVVGAAVMPAQAATEQEAVKCGVAVHKLLSNLLVGIAKAQPKVCKEPGDISELAGKILEKLTKAVNKANSKFSAAVCDPDLSTSFPLMLTLTPGDIEGAIVSSSFLGQDPPDTFCDNIMTP